MSIELTSLIIPLYPLLATLLVWAVVALCLRRYVVRRVSDATAASDGLPDPGQSMRKTILRLDMLFRINGIYLIGLPLVLCVAYGGMRLAGAAQGSLWEIALMLASAVLLVLICLFRLMGISRRRKQIKLDYQGKQVAAPAFEPLLQEGCFIFHDFECEHVHIDHLIVGPKGVFAVHTQPCAALPCGPQNDEVTVTYNGRALFYPKGETYEPLEQANRHAEWISEWLSQCLEEPIAARAIVAMPGWMVKRTSADGIPVVNPKQFDSLFKHINARPLSESALRSMVSRIEQHYGTTPLAVSG